MTVVKFWVLLGNELALASAHLDDSLARLFRHLRDDADAALFIPAKVAYDACEFYRLNRPVTLDVEDAGERTYEDDDAFLEQAKKACWEESNRERVSPTTRVSHLAEKISSDYVYLIVRFPNVLREANRAIDRLRTDHDVLFKCLQVTVNHSRDWRLEDVKWYLQGGILANNADNLPPELKEMQEALAKPRLYRADRVEELDVRNARSYGTQFDRVFAPAETGSHTVISEREFATFYNVLRCFSKDARMITDETSASSFKASNFIVHFIQPPFFCENDGSRGFRYHQEKTWDFPIFVDTTSARNAWRKFTPQSDWMVTSPGFKIPFVISKVMAQTKEHDRSQMLLEAISLARAGQFLLKSTSTTRFFVVAVYVDANMVVSRYLVMQTGPGDTKDKPVFIHQKDFNLAETEEEIDFLREMYNVATQITALSCDLDQLKEKSLDDIKVAADRVLSLSSTHQSTTSGSSSIRLGRRGAGGSEDEDNLGVFEAEDIQNILHQMDYEIDFIPWGHPQLAVIVDKTGDNHGYIKYVDREREIQVLQYLTEIESPSNYTISGVRFWPVQGGTVISMPVAGGWLTALDYPSQHLWSVAVQLFEAIVFMHEHNVAHMDLKPQNVIIPPECGRLSIIDFSVSIHVRGPDVRYTGVVGTEDYMAPEIRKGQYKPMLADLWSCGKTLENFCSCCNASADRTKLLEIAGRLMNRDPEARPKISTVLEWAMLAQRGEDIPVVSPTLR